MEAEKQNILNYEGRSFNVVIGVLQGVLLIPFTFRLLQPFEVFSLDWNTLSSLEIQSVKAEK